MSLSEANSKQSETGAGDPAHPSLLNRLSRQDRWLRLLWMLVYVFVGYFVALALVFLSFVQWGFVLLTTGTNQELSRLLTTLRGFLSDVFLYVCFHQDHKPFPFAPIASK